MHLFIYVLEITYMFAKVTETNADVCTRCYITCVKAVVLVVNTCYLLRCFVVESYYHTNSVKIK